MNPRVISVLGSGPVSLPEARQHLNLDTDGDSPPAHPDDDLVTRMLGTAIASVEKYTERRMVRVELELPLDCLPPSWCGRAPWPWTVRASAGREGVALPGAPLREVSQVTYVDVNGATQIVDPSSYHIDDFAEPGRLLWARGAARPAVNANVPNPVRVTYVAGYADPGDSPDTPRCPDELVSAALLMLGHLYENREAVVLNGQPAELPLSVQYLVRPLKLHLGY